MQASDFAKAAASLAILLGALPATAQGPDGFHAAKRLAAEIYQDHAKTFYCGCDYRGSQVDWRGCGYHPRKNAERARRLEWEHVVPAWEIGHQRQCWQQGGRAECERSDTLFGIMTGDLHNLVPAIGEVNGDRSNYRYSMVEGEARRYGVCDIEVDFKARRAEPPPSRRGDVARIYFYMRDRYGLDISRQQQQLFEAWARTDPVDAWEHERNRRIEDLQGNGNCYVSGDCRVERFVIPADSKFDRARPSLDAVGFSCRSEKRLCRQMSSCEEARFHLQHCAMSTLDRDGGGTPCESVCR